MAFPGTKGFIQTKYFEYVASGSPVILFSNNKDEIEDIHDRTGAGPIARNTDAMGQLLLEGLTRKRKGQPAFERSDVQHATEFEASRQMTEWVNFMTTTIANT